MTQNSSVDEFDLVRGQLGRNFGLAHELDATRASLQRQLSILFLLLAALIGAFISLAASAPALRQVDAQTALLAILIPSLLLGILLILVYLMALKLSAHHEIRTAAARNQRAIERATQFLNDAATVAHG